MITADSGSRTVRGGAGADLRVHDLGDAGPAVLFAHATGFHGRAWGPVAAALAEQPTPIGHRWAVDLRGHGDSPLPSTPIVDWWGFGADVGCAVAAVADGAPVVGVGHSLGSVALLMAEVERPGTFDRLFLYEPALRQEVGPLSDRDAAVQAMMISGARSRRATFPSRADALWNFAAKPPLAQLNAQALRAYVAHGFTDLDGGEGPAVTLKCTPETEAQTYATSFDHDLLDRLDAVSCPVVVAAGDRTTPELRRAADLLARRLGSSAVVIPGLDHFGPLQQPARFAEWLGSAVGRTGR